jgi:4-carboxymuconolactone decarboxylase
MAKLLFNPKDLDAHDRAIYEAIILRRKNKGASFGGPYDALMNHPALCQKIEELGYYLKFEGHLSREVYQFVVLAVAKETGTAFEWIDHVKHAIAAGVPQVVIDLLQTRGLSSDFSCFPDPFQVATRVLNSTLFFKNISDDIQAKAIEAYGKMGFIEIVVLSGFYQMFSAINQGFDVAL